MIPWYNDPALCSEMRDACCLIDEWGVVPRYDWEGCELRRREIYYEADMGGNCLFKREVVDESLCEN